MNDGLKHGIDRGKDIELRVIENETKDHDHHGHKERMEDNDVPPRSREDVLLVVML